MDMEFLIEGAVSTISKRVSKKGNDFAQLTLETAQGNLTVKAFDGNASALLRHCQSGRIIDLMVEKTVNPFGESHIVRGFGPKLSRQMASLKPEAAPVNYIDAATEARIKNAQSVIMEVLERYSKPDSIFCVVVRPTNRTTNSTTTAYKQITYDISNRAFCKVVGKIQIGGMVFDRWVDLGMEETGNLSV